MPSSSTAILPEISTMITTVAGGKTLRWRTSRSTGNISAMGVS
jgi:hypothetical protein